ncbi:MAG: YeeE/YedE thiosulfate transporter family protein [Nitrobacter sp.]
MADLFAGAMPLKGLIGGLMIGTASAIMLLGLGRIAGVSGLAARATGIAFDGAPRPLSIAFVIGLPLGGALIALAFGPVLARFEQGIVTLIIGGLLVGFGTRLGSGCTSGDGVCRMSRLSPRSLIATATFMVAGFATVAVMKAAGLG